MANETSIVMSADRVIYFFLPLVLATALRAGREARRWSRGNGGPRASDRGSMTGHPHGPLPDRNHEDRLLGAADDFVRNAP